MAIIKQVQIETNGVLNDIGAKYDNAENEIQATYGNDLSLLNGNLKLLAKDNTELASIPLNQTKYLYLKTSGYGSGGYYAYPSLTSETALLGYEFIDIVETAIAQNDTVILILPTAESTLNNDLFFRLTARKVVESEGPVTATNPLVAGATGVENYIYSYAFMSNDNDGKIITIVVSEWAYDINDNGPIILYEINTVVNTLSDILPVYLGGTGVTSFTANSIIMSGASTTSPLVTRPITNNTTNIAISNNNTNIPTMNTVYYGLATINGNSQHRGINIYAPTDATNAVLNDVAVYNSSTGAAEFKTLATMQVNTGYHFEENQTLDSNTTSGITAKVTTTSNNLGVLELSWISLSSDGAATVATGGFTDNTATAAYADGNVRSW